MSAATTVPEEPKPFDAKAFVAERNLADGAQKGWHPPSPPKPELEPTKQEAKPPEPKVEEPKEEKEPEKVDKPPEKPAQVASPEPQNGSEEHQPRLPRSVRRDLNRKAEEIGRLKGLLEAYEKMGVRLPEQEKPPILGFGKPDDLEPQVDDFTDDSSYYRSLAAWSGRQEARRIVAEQESTTKDTQKQKEWQAHVAEMDAKATKDKEIFPDWEEVAADEESEVEFSPDEHPTLMGLIASSDMRAAVLYHLKKNPDEFQKLLDKSDDPGSQIRAFARLEGRIEKMYNPSQKQETAAQAAEPPKPKVEEAPKDRTHPAEAVPAGRTAVDRDVHKPRPSTAVAAPGGSTPPEEPAIGSREWMRMRNQSQFAR